MLRNAFENISTEAKQELIRVLLASLDTKIQLNEDGRVKVASMPGQYALATGNITASGQSVYLDVSNISNLVMHCKPAPSVAGHNCTFEGSIDSTNGTDGTWFGIQAVRSNANTVETTTGALAAAPAYGWELSVNATNWVRVRATAHTSGTMTWMIQPGSYATEPIPAIQAHAISGTVTTTANVGTVAPVLYADTTTNLAGSAAYTGTSRDAGSTPAYPWFCARAYADQAGTLNIQDSTDNTTWRTVASVAVAAGEAKTLESRTLARYNRAYYVNGATGQGVFRLTSGYQRI
jgi:hypothetical protein